MIDPLPDPAESLDELLEGDEPPWDEDPTPAPNPERADAMLRRLARAKTDRARDLLFASDRMATIEAWAQERTAIYDRQIAWLEASLTGYARGVYVRTGTKTIQLPAGTLRSRQGQPAWSIENEQALLDWAYNNAPAMISRPPAPPPRIDRNVMKATLRPYLETGEKLPPGVTVEPPVRIYTVEPNTEDYQ